MLQRIVYNPFSSMRKTSASDLQQLQHLLAPTRQVRLRAEELYRNIGAQVQRAAARIEATRAERAGQQAPA